MKTRLLTLLCCPRCQGELSVAVLREKDEIEEGLLTCGGCARTYPIIGGIPRMLPDPLVAEVVRYHRDFFDRYRDQTASYRARAPQVRPDGWWRAEGRTIQSYSYQWRKFKEMLPEWEQVFLDSIKPVTREFFAGRVGVDGGCGFGRSLYYAAGYGAEMIGLDLSEAVEAARENTRHLDCVHVVQGDIFHPPIRPGSLDFAYSIGVLSLLPDPRGGFLSLSRLVKAGAPVFMWVFARGRGRQIAAFSLMRVVTTRLPLRMLNLVTFTIAALQSALWILPYRLLRAFAATAPLAARIPFTSYAQFPFRTLHADWFDTLSMPLLNYHRREEVAAWYHDAGFEQVRIDPDWNGRAFGRSPAKAGQPA